MSGSRFGELAPLLRDPLSREPLRAVEGPGGPALVSCPSGRRFPIRDGIAVFVADAGPIGFRERYRRLHARIVRLRGLATWHQSGFRRASEAERRRRYLRGVEAPDEGRVLEVAVGAGANLPLLAPKAWYFGVDPSWRLLRRCRRRGEQHGLRLNLFQGAAEQLPFRDGVFDSVFHVGGLCFFADRARAIAEMVRVAKPATRIVIVDEVESFAIRRSAAPTALLPPGMREVESFLVAGWELCCLSFRTPAEGPGRSVAVL